MTQSASITIIHHDLRRRPSWPASDRNGGRLQVGIVAGFKSESPAGFVGICIGRVREIKDEVLSRPGRYAEITPNLRAKEVVVGAASHAGGTSCASTPRRPSGRSATARNSWSAPGRARPPRQRSSQGRMPPGRLQALRLLPVARRSRPAVHRSRQDPACRAARRQVRADHQRRHAVRRRHRARLQGHVDHRGVLPSDQYLTGLGIRPMFHWTPRLIVAARQALACCLDDPAGGGAGRRGAVVAARRRPAAPQGCPLHRGRRDHCSGQPAQPRARRDPEKLDVSAPKPILAVG